MPGVNPEETKVVEAPCEITIPPSAAVPTVYEVPLAGAVGAVEVAVRITRYPVGALVAAVNEPLMDVSDGVKFKAVG